MKLIIFILLFISTKSYSQNSLKKESFQHKLNRALIEKKITNTDSTIQIDNDSKIVSNYLGEIRTNKGRRFHLVKAYYAFNLTRSPTIESHIFIYNEKHEFVGYYYLSTINYLPKCLKNNKLYFNISDEKCNKQSIVDFKKGIPRFINIKCKDNNYFEFKS